MVNLPFGGQPVDHDAKPERCIAIIIRPLGIAIVFKTTGIKTPVALARGQRFTAFRRKALASVQAKRYKTWDFLSLVAHKPAPIVQILYKQVILAAFRQTVEI